jgi:hypothetical protein
VKKIALIEDTTGGRSVACDITVLWLFGAEASASSSTGAISLASSAVSSYRVSSQIFIQVDAIIAGKPAVISGICCGHRTVGKTSVAEAGQRVGIER